MRKAWLALAATQIAAACALPAQAQQAMPALADAAGRQPLMLQPTPAEVATPPSYDPLLAAERFGGAPGGCDPGWPCRLQLFGVIDRNGGVGLKGTVLSW